MIRSMTGYGRANCQIHSISITVEMRSVNHRYCDITFRMPKHLLYIEDKMKKVIQKYVSRGKLEIYITVEGEGLTARTLSIDWDLMDQYIEGLKQAEKRYEVNGNVNLDSLLKVDDLFTVVEKEAKIESLEEKIIATVEEAAEKLCRMREKEGRSLKDDIANKLASLENYWEELNSYSDRVTKAYQERLHKKIEELTSDAVVDENRILTEVAIFADKASIDEELIRLRSHVKQFYSILTEEVIGRKLDFLVQELNRELNTIGSKANDYKISQKVVEMKSEIEKIREQVQNIE
ncbi:YicC/YloC family endoribonuclease [Pseudalkalibacillus caeni]|uniref:YicC family protein n=1 Tax=Exobacillus caeni TaxID=2574798 RepID=A0A5R9F2K2_9BACL|nr:YicC/YloC family endoribonuclease [Pseudalkalibacillus caeni]TLS37311.1 YicC family protein [Pseudalkalibacillus caeni]